MFLKGLCGSIVVNIFTLSSPEGSSDTMAYANEWSFTQQSVCMRAFDVGIYQTSCIHFSFAKHKTGLFRNANILRLWSSGVMMGQACMHSM